MSPDPSADELAAHASVALITALSKEEAAMKAMLDNVVPYSTKGRAPGEYHLGTVPAKHGGTHIVVLARCSAGENLATANTTILFERFPRLQVAIMVGIAGAAPDPSKPEHDIRLGDIVVSSAVGSIQYDMDKELLRGGKVEIEPRHPARPPSARLHHAAGDLATGEREGRRPWEAHFSRADHLPGVKRPTLDDVLHDESQPPQVVDRSVRERPGLPYVFSGPIASGNKLLKNVRLRERLRTSFGVKAVEMEAAGVADAAWLQAAGYFVVRGTCDYCDEFKEDQWQEHAAMIAAAYARSLLEATSAADLPGDPFSKELSTPPAQLPGVPNALREPLLASTAPRLSYVCREIDALIHAHETTSASISPSWPLEETWVTLVCNSLQSQVESLAPGFALEIGERAVLAAWPFFFASLADRFITNIFEDKPLVRRLFATTPAALDLLDMDLPDDGKRLVVRWAFLRLLHEQRTQWTDAWIRTNAPDVPLGRWLAADPYATATLRATGGNAADFSALPEQHFVRLDDQKLKVRWRMLASLISLAELRVLGAHLLPTEAVEHIAQLPEITGTVEEQFKRVSLEDRRDNWVIRASCDEPVMDYALSEMAASLNEEIRTRRAAMSDYLARTAQRAFPTIDTDIHPTLLDGQRVYTTPHVLFTFSPEHARRLFMGSDLWGNPAFAFRELFQNALDACRYRKARSQYLELDYDPFIRMHHGRLPDGTEYVECEDNGIGMTRELLARCFAAAGRRFVETDEFRREQDAWSERGIHMNTNSRFGIGIFSYFLVAKRLEIETARLGTEGEEPTARLLVHIPTASSFFRIVSRSAETSRAAKRARAEERGENYSAALGAGTRVRLIFPKHEREDATIGNVTTCVDAIRGNVFFSEVRTLVSDYRGQTFSLEPGVLTWTDTHKSREVDPRVWWRTDIGDIWLRQEDMDSVTTFRSRREGPSKPVVYSLPGRVLVDGIVTDVTTPGFIVNLTGSDAPSLSPDRRKIRGDVAPLLERLVSEAIDNLPDPVPGVLLHDLWLYDPRVCHRVAQDLLAKKRAWLRRIPGVALYAQDPRETVEATDVGYTPALERSSSFSGYAAPDYRPGLFALWRIAHDAADSRTEEPVVLQERQVGEFFRRSLARIPASVWDKWTSLEFGIPEICAMQYGVEKAAETCLTLLAYMSWLSGDTMPRCLTRLQHLCGFFAIPCSAPQTIPDVVVSDFEGWVLGHGGFAKPWAGPTIANGDVLEYAGATGKAIDDAIAEVEGVALRLGFPTKLDQEGLRSLGTVTEGEGRFASRIEDARLGLGRLGVDDDERAERIAAIVGVPCPPKEWSDDVTAWETKHRPMVREVTSFARYSGVVDLAALCSAASIIEKPPRDTADAVRNLVPTVPYPLTWTEEGLTAVSALDEVDWILAKSRLYMTHAIRAESSLKLASKLAENGYRLRRIPSADLHRRVSNIYGLFGWGDAPVTEAQIEVALHLTSSQSKLLAMCVQEGRVMIPRLIYAAVTENRSLTEIDSDVRALVELGAAPPESGDTYLGLRWSDLLAEVETSESQNDE